MVMRCDHRHKLRVEEAAEDGEEPPRRRVWKVLDVEFQGCCTWHVRAIVATRDTWHEAMNEAIHEWWRRATCYDLEALR